MMPALCKADNERDRQRLTLEQVKHPFGGLFADAESCGQKLSLGPVERLQRQNLKRRRMPLWPGPAHFGQKRPFGLHALLAMESSD